MAMSAQGKAVGRTDELIHGTTKKFTLRCQSKTVEGLLVCYEGDIFAYVNECCHIPLSMDWMDNQFFSDDKRYLICANHGATYKPNTGECVWGPCFGASLVRIPVRIKEGRILAFCPEI
jgi:nitrite reductase/ring-hydroxylating ferredoxin subunit